MSMYENVGMTSLDYMEEILRLRKALADVADECSKAYDKIAQLENPWISVEDRMPELNTWVLIYAKFMIPVFEMERGIRKSEDVYKEFYTGRFMHGDIVTHWMPLPESPESEE